MREDDEFDGMPDGIVDGIIDAALTTYAGAGPASASESALADRVLARIAAAPALTPRRRWTPWVLALPAAACLILVMFMHSRPRIAEPRTVQTHETARLDHPEVPIRRAESHPTPGREIAQRAEAATPHPRPVAIAAAAQPLPKLDIFPTPQPLTPEEQALVNFAAHATESERQSFLAAQKQADAPLHIAALHIDPIRIPPLEAPAHGAN